MTDTPTPDAIKARLRQILTAYRWQELLTVDDIRELAEEQARLEDMLAPTENETRAFARVG